MGKPDRRYFFKIAQTKRYEPPFFETIKRRPQFRKSACLRHPRRGGKPDGETCENERKAL